MTKSCSFKTAVGFAIGAASTGSGATEDAGARVRSRPGETRARGDSERAIPVPARRLSPRSRRARRKNPRARGKRHVRNIFVPRTSASSNAGQIPAVYAPACRPSSGP